MDYFVSWNMGIVIGWMWYVFVWQCKNVVYFFGRKWNSRWVDLYIAVVVFLY